MDVGVTLSLLTLIGIAVLYASFDLFNRRNVPDVFAYLSVAAGFVVTFAFHQSELALSLAIAALVGIVGYAIYRMGLWGAGDYFELMAISLIFPIQPSPLFTAVPQLGLPFILSVFVATGFASIWIVPVYYLVFARKRWERNPDAKHVIFGLSLLVLYAMLYLLFYYFYGFDLGRMVLLALVAVPSSLTLIFENEITERMIERVYPRQLDDGDIIAFNMMSRTELRHFAKYEGFGRLATKKLKAKMRNEKAKLPVYKNAAPLAVFILIGIGVALFFGNIVLFII